MQCRTVGGTGTDGSPCADQENCARVVHEAPHAGADLIDTADGYSAGKPAVVVVRRPWAGATRRSGLPGPVEL